MATYERIHPLPPLYDGQSRVLILGTLPSPLSRKNQIYYGNPRNRFWPLLAAIFNESLPETPEEKRALALRHSVAISDVLAAGDIVGASDASIKNPVPNDFSAIFATADISTIFTTGTKATTLFRRFCAPSLGKPCLGLPSPSPANVSWSFERLLPYYQAIALAVDGGDPQSYLDSL